MAYGQLFAKWGKEGRGLLVLTLIYLNYLYNNFHYILLVSNNEQSSIKTILKL